MGRVCYRDALRFTNDVQLICLDWVGKKQSQSRSHKGVKTGVSRCCISRGAMSWALTRCHANRCCKLSCDSKMIDADSILGRISI